MGVGPGAISIDAGAGDISSFGGATLVWDTKTRGQDNPSARACDAGFLGFAPPHGNQLLLRAEVFGSSSQGLSPYVFVYKAGTFALTDSIAVGSGPAAIVIRTF
jgi:hypothetical protein